MPMCMEPTQPLRGIARSARPHLLADHTDELSTRAKHSQCVAARLCQFRKIHLRRREDAAASQYVRRKPRTLIPAFAKVNSRHRHVASPTFGIPMVFAVAELPRAAVLLRALAEHALDCSSNVEELLELQHVEVAIRTAQSTEHTEELLEPIVRVHDDVVLVDQQLLGHGNRPLTAGREVAPNGCTSALTAGENPQTAGETRSGQGSKAQRPERKTNPTCQISCAVAEELCAVAAE